MMGKGALRRQTDFGEELFCHQCAEWWPATTEFFFITHRHMSSPCKACVAESREINNAQKPCVVEGCDQPRHKTLGQTRSRCFEHWQEQNNTAHLKSYKDRKRHRIWAPQELDEIKMSELALAQLARKFNTSVTTIFRIKHRNS